ncbi:c6 finger domain protein [Moniliophthora roreri MCA 2997]|uniref:C6 finger domain protein n=2 Tax=Moniliophthora roreri TaxID=221103 RepID=V2WUE1_MONRO|nr:c6 finger domain protein [Moniliophthora roreri MCA 2997]KAI3609038.1 c6 finger domain protein [Moniliophthora roreri]
MSRTGSATAFKFEGVIRFHTKSRSGCLTCRKRHIKCDETKPVCRKCYRRNLECVQRPKNEHNQERQQQQQQEIVVHKPLTAPTPIPMSITSRQIMHHFTTATSVSLHSEPGCIDILCTVSPQLSWDNPHLFHSLLSCASLHLGRLYPEEPKWIHLGSAHRKAAIAALPGATDPDAKYLTVGFLTTYTISSSLSSSPKNIFSLMTSLHNVFSPFVGRHLYVGQKVKALDPFSANLQVDLVEALGHLQQIYDFRMPGFESESEELFDPTIRAAYRKAVEALYVVYRLSRTGYEMKGAVLWPTLFGGKFRDLLNERRQRALVVLYYYLGMLRCIDEKFWWAKEAGGCQDYIYGLLNVVWRGWILQYDGVMKNYSIADSTRLTY